MSPYIPPAGSFEYKESQKAKADICDSSHSYMCRGNINAGARLSCGSRTVSNKGIAFVTAIAIAQDTTTFAESYINGVLKASDQCSLNTPSRMGLSIGYGDIEVGQVMEGKIYNSSGSSEYYTIKAWSGVVIGA